MQNSENVIKQEQLQPQARAKTAGKTKTTAGLDTPNCGQVPVSMPMSPMLSEAATHGSDNAGSQAGTQASGTVVAQPPKMMMTQTYSPHIALASVLLSLILGIVIFKMRTDRKRFPKKCPHCAGRLERWADECPACGKDIFVYPADQGSGVRGQGSEKLNPVP